MPCREAPGTFTTEYRPDIDGLRAVAVLSVLAYHYGLPLPGGFTGVDVFFVISGYLITSRIHQDIAAGRFSVLEFYDRRIRRIVPALLLMLVVTLIAGKFLLMPGDYQTTGAAAAAAALGISNFFFFAHTGYFDQAADLMPLLHTWSLAVEEQFYVVWPLLLLAIVSGRKPINIAAVIAAITIAGIGASIVWFNLDKKFAFYMVLPRAWELTIGALLVFLPRLPRAFGEAAVLSGLALIATGFWFTSAASFPGLVALYPCLGAALVIWPRTAHASTATWLGWLRPIGLISYSLYLWHWPVWVFYRFYINGSAPGPRETAIIALVSVLIAILSCRYVERPFRTRRWPPALTVKAGLLACGLVFCWATYIDSADGLPGRLSPDHAGLRSGDVMWQWPCKLSKVAEDLPPLCTFGAPWVDGVEKAILWGDSNAEHLTPMLQLVAKQANVSVLLHYGCYATVDENVIAVYLGRDNDRCTNQKSATYRLLERQPEIRTVIIAGSWPYQLHHFQGRGLHSNVTSKPKLLELSTGAMVERIQSMGRKAVIIDTVPQWKRDPTSCNLLNVGLLRRQCRDDERFLFRSDAVAGASEALEAFRQVVARYPRTQLIVPSDRLCAEERCITRVNGEAIYRDGVHLRRNLREDTDRKLAKLIGIDQAFSE